MKKLCSTVGMSEEQWQESRLGPRIGGSEGAGILGLSPFKNDRPFTIWLRKTRRIPIEKRDSFAMELGRELEDAIARMAAPRIEEGAKIRRRNAIFRHDEHEFMIMDLDREVRGSGPWEQIECKSTSNAAMWADGIPDHVQVQLQHYISVRGSEGIWLAVYQTGFASQFSVEWVPRNQQLIDILIGAERTFADMVINNVPPAVDESDATAKALDVLYGAGRPVARELTEEAAEWARKYDEAKADKADADARQKLARNQIVNFLGEHHVGYGFGWELSYAPPRNGKPILDEDALRSDKDMSTIIADCSPPTFDADLLRSRYPAVFEKFSHKPTERRISVKRQKVEDTNGEG